MAHVRADGERAPAPMPIEATASSSAAMREMKEALSHLETERGRLAGFDFVPRRDDVFIVTTPKVTRNDHCLYPRHLLHRCLRH